MLKVCKLYLVFTAPFTEIDNIPETVDGSRDDCLATVVWMAYWYSSFNSKKTFIFFAKNVQYNVWYIIGLRQNGETLDVV